MSQVNISGMVIGSLGIVASILLITLFTFTLTNADWIAENFGYNSDQTIIDDAHFLIIAFCICFLLFLGINFITSGLLIWGTLKKRYLMLLPWLINSGFLLGVTSLVVCAFFRGFFYYPAKITVFGFLFSFLILAFEVFIYAYILDLFDNFRRSQS